MVAGGRVWAFPYIQQIQRISLNTMTLIVESPKVYTKLGVPVSVTGIAQVSPEVFYGQNRKVWVCWSLGEDPRQQQGNASSCMRAVSRQNGERNRHGSARNVGGSSTGYYGPHDGRGKGKDSWEHYQQFDSSAAFVISFLVVVGDFPRS